MGYQNAVTDKLVVILRGVGSSLLISSKHGHPKYFLPEGAPQDQDELSGLLSSSIFASTTVVVCNSPFVLCSSELSAQEKQEQLQTLSGKTGDIRSCTFAEGIEQWFYLPDTLPSWWRFLVHPEYSTDLAMGHRYKAGGPNSNAIFFSVLDEQLAIRVYSGDRLILANRYPATSTDEIFYFVLFAVEQLKLDMSTTQVEFIGSDERYQVFQELFRNYLPHLLHLPLLGADPDGIDHQREYQDDWFARLCLQCVS